MSLRLVVDYDGPGGLRKDWDGQLKVGGFFAAIGAPAGLPPFAEMDLVFRIAGAEALRTRGRVTVANATSVCFEILPDARAALTADVDSACVGSPPMGDRIDVRFVDREEDAARAESPTALDVAGGDEPGPGGDEEASADGASGASADGAAGAGAEAVAGAPNRPKAVRARDLPEDTPLARKIAVMTIGEKVQMAAHGDAEARLLLARERTSGVQLALLKNPKLGQDEVMALARSPHINPEAAEAISRHPTWGGSGQIALMLVRNPRIPVTLASTLVGKLTNTDLRMVAKGAGVRGPVAAAARKRLLG